MKKKKWIIAVILILGLGGLGVWYFTRQRTDNPQVMRIVSVERGNIRKTILTTGLVQPYNRLEIKPPIGGRVEEILIKEGDSVRKGQILTWMSSSERAVLLDAARARGPEVLHYWETLYKATPLIAPVDGVIIAKNVQPGQTVAQADPVLVMSDRLIVKAQVDETDIGEVKDGELSEITLDAYPQQKLQGQVDHIAYEAKILNNVTVYEVDVVVKNIPPFMRSGMTANVVLVVGEKENVLTLPTEAIRGEKGKNFVLLVNPEGVKPISKEVELGLSDGKKVEILSGLQEGDKVFIRLMGPRPERKQAGKNPFSSNPAPRGR